MAKLTVRAIALTAMIVLAPGLALAQTAQIPQNVPKAPVVPIPENTPVAPNVMTPSTPALPVPGAPIPLVDGAYLPDGQVLHLGSGESAHAIPRADGYIDQVIVDFQDGKERMRLVYKQGSTQLLKGEEHRADGSLKWNTMPTFGGPPAIIRYWPKPNDSSVYTISERWGKTGKRVEYRHAGKRSSMLTKQWDDSGKLVGETVVNDVTENTTYEWNDVPGEGVYVTYFFDDIGGVDFNQQWKSLPGTPEPLVTVSWTNDQGLPESYDVTLTSDGSRAVKVVYKNKAGDEVTETVTTDGKYIAARKVVDSKTKATIKDVTFTARKPRLEIPDLYLKAPPKPVDPASIGLSDPN
ncbi:MAG TPA: hypothetical protein V6D22_03920 [Candidatus Obscuribacterales bacterium]